MQSPTIEQLLLDRSCQSYSRSILNHSTLESDNCYMRQSIKQEMGYLQKYRDIKPNQNLRQEGEKSILPPIVCKFFGMQPERQQECKPLKCQCPHSENDLCNLILGWVEEHYYWKTDRQFHRIYQNYRQRALPLEQQQKIKEELKKVKTILGLEISVEDDVVVLQILTSYCKHANYYGKNDKLIGQSNLYIWVTIGIMYHIGFSGRKATQLQKVMAFWALDISMDNFEDLSPVAFQILQAKALKSLQFYFAKWIDLLSSHKIEVRKIISEWSHQMMFGYMGIESIGFFLDCFRKVSWDYLIKVMLSYFSFRTNQLKKDTFFQKGAMTKEQLLQQIINGKEEWPMVFCFASSFSIN